MAIKLLPFYLWERKMININGKEWKDVTAADVEAIVRDVDQDESFFFEFKEDDVAPGHFIKEVSALANTYGGYIFLGISKERIIKGCSAWNEDRIHTTMRDSITPMPVFEVRRLTCQEKTIYIVKIDEGSEPPYVTNKGAIYERISSASCPIKDSSKLLHLYQKNERRLCREEEKITIPPIKKESANIYGYIDVGFSLTVGDRDRVCEALFCSDLKVLLGENYVLQKGASIIRVGESIIYTAPGLSVDRGGRPAHTNNFMEIMADGSAKMRILLCNNHPEKEEINMFFPLAVEAQYRQLYTQIMSDLLDSNFVYAKKYERLHVERQFTPIVSIDKEYLTDNSGWKAVADYYSSKQTEQTISMGVSNVVTNDRIPKTGLYTVDRKLIERWGVERTTKGIIDTLFSCSYLEMGDYKPSFDC